MIDPDRTLSNPPSRKTAIEEEQLLCNEALRTRDYDNYSEQEWQVLCEKAHQKGRAAFINETDSPRKS